MVPGGSWWFLIPSGNSWILADSLCSLGFNIMNFTATSLGINEKMTYCWHQTNLEFDLI